MDLVGCELFISDQLLYNNPWRLQISLHVCIGMWYPLMQLLVVIESTSFLSSFPRMLMILTIHMYLHAYSTCTHSMPVQCMGVKNSLHGVPATAYFSYPKWEPFQHPCAPAMSQMLLQWQVNKLIFM